MGTLHLPLIFNLENRDSTATTDAKMVNAYAEVLGEKKGNAVKRAGIGSGVLYAAGTAQGVVVYGGIARVVVNNSFYRTPSISSSLGTTGQLIDFA